MKYTTIHGVGGIPSNRQRVVAEEEKKDIKDAPLTSK